MKKILIISSIAMVALAFSSCSSTINVKSVKDSDQQNSTASPTEGNIVYFSKSGFEPKETILTQGESLTIINNSSDKILIASDPHPRDSAYLPLNSSKPIYPKSSSIITFDTVGQFGYHNEYNTSQVGKVIVK